MAYLCLFALTNKEMLRVVVCALLVCTLPATANAAVDQAQGAGEAKWLPTLAQLVFNKRISEDYLDIVYSDHGGLLIPADNVFRMGEAEVIRHGPQIWEFKVASLGSSLWIDYENLLMRANGEESSLEAWQVDVVFDALLIDVTIIEALFGLTIDFDELNMLLTVQTTRPWPLDLRLAREMRWRRMQVVQASGPQAKTYDMPYKWWGAPQLNVAASVSESNSGPQVSNFSVQGVAEAAFLTHRFSLNGGLDDGVQSVRLSSGRRDPRGGLLGLDNLYEFTMGDVSGFSVPLARGAGSGVGAVVRAVPLTVPDNFDVTFVTGEAPLGWSAELYLDAQLYDFQRVNDSGQYRFDDIPLRFGSNAIVVKLYGPNGQEQLVDYSQRVGSRLKVGELHWQAHAGKPLMQLFELQDTTLERPDAWVGSFKSNLGLSQNISAGLSFARVAEVDELGETHTGEFYGIDIQPFVGDTAFNINYSFQDSGAQAYSLRTSLSLGKVSLGLGYENYDDEFGNITQARNRLKNVYSVRTSLPLDWLGLGRQRLGVSFNQDSFIDGSRLDKQELNYGHSLWGVNVSHRYNSNQRYSANGSLNSEFDDYRLLASVSRDLLTLRGELNYGIKPLNEFRNARISSQYRVSDWQNLNAGISFNGGGQTSYSLSYTHLFDALSLSMNASSGGGDWAVGLSITTSFGIVPGYGVRLQPTMSLERGMALITATETWNNQAAMPVQGLKMMVNQRNREQATNADGQLVVDDLDTLSPAHLSVSRFSLPDPFMVSTLAQAQIWPRPGQSIRLPITLVESSFVSGSALLQLATGQRVPLRRMFIELVDDEGRVRAETLTLDDGFYEFEEAFSGRWAVRLKENQPNLHAPMNSRSLAFEIAPGELEKSNIDLIFKAEVLEQQPEQEIEDAEPIDKAPKLPADLMILFGSDQGIFFDRYDQGLADIAKFVAQHPQAYIVVVGHTDLNGSNAYNLALSKRRAEAVQARLATRFKVLQNRIRMTYFGEAQPLHNSVSKAYDQLNRRVTVSVLLGGQ